MLPSGAPAVTHRGAESAPTPGAAQRSRQREAQFPALSRHRPGASRARQTSCRRLLLLYISPGTFAVWVQQQPGSALDGAGLWRYLLSIARQEGLEGFDQPLERALRQGGLLLLLDGLGKIVDPALRLEVAEAVASLAESGAWLALTCRTRAFTGAVAEAFAAWGAPVTLAPFGLGQIRHLVRSWQGHLVEQGAIERCNRRICASGAESASVDPHRRVVLQRGGVSRRSHRSLRKPGAPAPVRLAPTNVLDRLFNKMPDAKTDPKMSYAS